MRRLFAIAACALAGCNAVDNAQDGGSPAQGAVRVQLTFTRDAAQAIRFDGQGHFVRFRAEDAEKVALLGLGDEPAVPLDGCRAADAGEAARALSGGTPGGVALLDAGRLLVKGPADATTLQPLHYPELTPYVAGVLYGGADAGALTLEPGALYEVAGEGGEEVGPFLAQAAAPRAFVSPTVDYRRGGDLDLAWAAGDGGAEPISITVAWSTRASSGELRCRALDDGAFRISGGLLPIPADEPVRAELTVERVRRAALLAPGAGRGELVVGLREVVPLATDDAGTR